MSVGRRIAERRSLAEEVYEVVREYLIEQKLEPGSRLVIDSMAEDLGVSPTPLREALARLEVDQFVVKEPHRGYSVAPLLSRDAFLELFEMRLVVEPRAAALAAQRADPEDLVTIAAAFDTMKRSDDGPNYHDLHHLLDGDAAFHAGIAQASGNRFLQQAIERLRTHQLAVRLYGEGGVPDRQRTLEEHASILQALERGSSKNAETLMREHLTRASHDLVTAIYGRLA